MEHVKKLLKIRRKSPYVKQKLNSPTAWNVKDKFSYLSVNSDGLEVNYTGRKQNAAAIRANHPIPPQCKLFYFEVEIIDQGKGGEIGIGFCTKKVNLNRMPGWENDSWGYHGNDGKIFHNTRSGEPYGLAFVTGDTVGCCLNFINNTAFYTKNGMNLGIAFQDLKGILYPCVGMFSQGGSVKVNFGHSKFKYAVMTDDDIDEDLKEKWVEILNPYNDELISQQMDQFADLIKSFETKQNIAHALRYRGKFNFIIGRYEQALADLTRLLEFETNDTFALRYRGDISNILGAGIHVESLFPMINKDPCGFIPTSADP